MWRIKVEGALYNLMVYQDPECLKNSKMTSVQPRVANMNERAHEIKGALETGTGAS